MVTRGAAAILRERIGNEATDALITMMDESSRSMGEQTLRTAGDRFERRLTEEISALRVEMHKGFGDLRAEIVSGKESAIRWAFLFWVGQVGAIGGLLAYLR